ncbi:hypothetical protein ACSBR2_017046 [Camellia fascicularis]
MPKIIQREKEAREERTLRERDRETEREWASEHLVTEAKIEDYHWQRRTATEVVHSPSPPECTSAATLQPSCPRHHRSLGT